MSPDSRRHDGHAEGGASASARTMAKYRDVIAFEGDDHRQSSYVLGDDGRRQQFRTSHHTPTP